MNLHVIDELNKKIKEQSDRMNDKSNSDWNRMDAANTVIRLLEIRTEMEREKMKWPL